MEYLIGIIVVLLGAVGFLVKKGSVRDSLLNYLTSNKELDKMSNKSESIKEKIDSEETTRDEIRSKLDEQTAKETVDALADFFNNRKK